MKIINEQANEPNKVTNYRVGDVIQRSNPALPVLVVNMNHGQSFALVDLKFSGIIGVRESLISLYDDFHTSGEVRVKAHIGIEGQL